MMDIRWAYCLQNGLPFGIVDVGLKTLDTRRLDELKPAEGGMRV